MLANARSAACAEQCFLLGREEFIVILVIVMACGLALPGVPHEHHA
jgi:hypothetical protein